MTNPTDAAARWQLIETAPREPLEKRFGYGPYGPDLLLFADQEICFGCWDDEAQKFYILFPEEFQGEPTHWMPLPAPPGRDK